MHADRPSTTASLVAFLRAVAHDGATTVPHFEDPVARQLLPAGWGMAASAVGTAVRAVPPLRQLGWLASMGMLDLIPVRTRVIDQAWKAAQARGVAQLVILGAGLDGRAWRLPQLEACTVFEVDHPATQTYKRRRVDGLGHLAQDVRFVGVDFVRDDLPTKLQAAGLCADVPTFFIWEGVTPYLTRSAQAQTLAGMAAVAAPGSGLVVTYTPPSPRRAGFAVLSRCVGWLGEPFVGLMEPHQLAALLAQAGFAADQDQDIKTWARHVGARVMPTGTYITRIAVAWRP